jgi:hypothetical protein
VYRLNYDRSLIDLLSRGFRFTQDTIEYVKNETVYLEFSFKDGENKYALLKAKNNDSEYLEKRREEARKLLCESYMFKIRDRWWLK